MATRLNRLEENAWFQDKALARLEESMLVQQRQLEALEKSLVKLQGQINILRDQAALASSHNKISHDDPLPPHYQNTAWHDG